MSPNYALLFFRKNCSCINAQGLPGDPGDPGLPGEPGPQIFIGTEFYSFCFAGVSFSFALFLFILKNCFKINFWRDKVYEPVSLISLFSNV